MLYDLSPKRVTPAQPPYQFFKKMTRKDKGGVYLQLSLITDTHLPWNIVVYHL